MGKLYQHAKLLKFMSIIVDMAIDFKILSLWSLQRPAAGYGFKPNREYTGII